MRIVDRGFTRMAGKLMNSFPLVRIPGTSVHLLLKTLRCVHTIFETLSTPLIIIYPLTARVVGAPQMISQPVSSIVPCSPLPSGTWRTPGLSSPWCCLPTSSSVCLVFFPLSLCLARWFWPDLMNGKHDHTTALLSLFTMVRRSSCSPIACWILTRTSSLVTWSLYEMRSILR